MKFLTSGKVKDIYEYDDSCLLFRFSNRVSAFDVKFNEEIPKKGEVLCQFAQYWFEKLGPFTKNHFIKRQSSTEIIVKKIKMIPMECVVRGYFYGSLVNRWQKDDDNKNIKLLSPGTQPILASKLPSPIFDPTTKSEHDVPIPTKESAVSQGIVTEQQFDTLASKSIEIYNYMSDAVDSAGFILADLKLEFGLDPNDTSNVVLADSIGPDEYRLWPKKSYRVGQTQESFDKQILRDWLAQNGYAKQFEHDRAQNKRIIPPKIPNDIIQKMTMRYVSSFENITKTTLDC